MKALDFSGALQSRDPMQELQALTSAYLFERNLLRTCKEKRLNRIATAIADGAVNVPGFPAPYSLVHYLIFEVAKGSIRDYVAVQQAFDLAWCLRSLHQSAHGIRQLHRNGIAHQDLKPSNVLLFEPKEIRIADLGRAHSTSVPTPLDAYQVPGDLSYAPPEQFYAPSARWSFEERCLADLWQLGSLFFFHFANCSARHALTSKVPPGHATSLRGTSLRNDLPYLESAMDVAFGELHVCVKTRAGRLADEIMKIVRYLCAVDPSKRGHPQCLRLGATQHDLERTIATLDFLARTAEARLK
jgi:serine/threonine protein kinase